LIFRESGALGSRLTGAGWGGCAVSLVRQENLEKFIADVREKYYINSKDTNRVKNADKSIFPTSPGCGIYAVRL
jgi:galactokinase